jgi:phosphosulfolactate synthase
MTGHPPFAFVELPAARSGSKPRSRGLTMMADWGIGLGHQRDLLELAGGYVDFAKIVTGTARLYRREHLEAKLEAYRAAEVRPFIGGQFHEYVFAEGGWQALIPFYREAVALGFDTIEISDNCLPLDDDERARQIAMAIDNGLKVFGEVGSKDAKSAIPDLVRQAEVCFAAGAEYVLVEAAELVEDGAIREASLAELQDRLDLARVMIELPGPWISGTTLSQVEDMKKLLVQALGPDVNLANLKPDDLIAMEALRTGLGVVGPKTRKELA